MTLSETVKKMLQNISLHFIIALICGLLANAVIKFDSQLSFINGLSSGAALSALKLLLMERGISKTLSVPANARVRVMLHITICNMLSAVLLTWAVLINSISIWGALAGLALLQSAAYTVKWKGV